MGREFFQCQIFTDVGIDIRKDLIYLGMIAGGFWFLFCGRAAPFIKCIVEKYHQFQKCGTIQDVFSESGIGAQFMNKIDKPGLFFCGEMELMRHIGPAELKTVIQIRLLCRNLF